MIGFRQREYNELLELAGKVLAGFIASGAGRDYTDEVLVERSIDIANALRKRCEQQAVAEQPR